MPFQQSGGGGSGVISGVTVSGTAAAGQVPVASSSSAGAWAYPPGFEIVYAQITSPVSITDTSEATATALITAGPATFDGGAVLVHFFAYTQTPSSAAATSQTVFTLFEGSTELTRMFIQRTIVTAAQNIGGVSAFARITPSAASHTYKLCAFTTSTTGTPQIVAGAGGTAADAPAFVRITKV